MTQTEYYISNELFKEILECVNFLHSKNIIHWDLKPENILVTDGTNGRFLKLGGFSLAVFHEFDGQTHTTDRGTPKYTAPEVKSNFLSLAVIVQQLFDFDIHSLVLFWIKWNVFNLTYVIIGLLLWQKMTRWWLKNMRIYYYWSIGPKNFKD